MRTIYPFSWGILGMHGGTAGLIANIVRPGIVRVGDSIRIVEKQAARTVA